LMAVLQLELALMLAIDSSWSNRGIFDLGAQLPRQGEKTLLKFRWLDEEKTRDATLDKQVANCMYSNYADRSLSIYPRARPDNGVEAAEVHPHKTSDKAEDAPRFGFWRCMASMGYV
jgi:hypothetical protein